MESTDSSKKTSSHVRHDMRNHVSVIRLYAQLLQQRLQEAGISEPRFFQYIDTIVERTKCLEEDIDRFM